MMKADVNNIKLYREVNHRVRYYSIRLYKALFGGFKNKKLTGIIKEHYDIIDQGVSAIKNIIDLKLNKGYYKDKRQVRD